MKRKYFGLIFHSLRRTAITNIVDAGVSADAAMSISGHTSQKVHDAYKQKLKERADRQAQEAKNKLETFFSDSAISQGQVKPHADDQKSKSAIN